MSSSIHIQKASEGSVHHNSRENFSHSVVFTDEKNELWNNAKDSFTLYRKELRIRSEAYSNATKQKLQSSVVTHLSSIVNLEKHHTLKDLEPIKEYLEKEFDTKIFQISIHRDEGKLKNKINGNYLVSGIDFFLNPKNNKHYFDKKYTKPLNLNDYEIEKNYHAHIEMMGLKSNGKAIRQDMNRYKLSNLQDFVAESLQMERGKKFDVDGSSKRLDTHEFKKAVKIENTVTKKVKIKAFAEYKKMEAELNKEIYSLRVELQELQAERPAYARLEQVNKELKEEVKNKTLTIEDLKERIELLKKDIYSTKYNNNGEPVKLKAVEIYLENKYNAEKKEKERIQALLDEKKSNLIKIEKINVQLAENEKLKAENEKMKEFINSLNLKIIKTNGEPNYIYYLGTEPEKTFSMKEFKSTIQDMIKQSEKEKSNNNNQGLEPKELLDKLGLSDIYDDRNDDSFNNTYDDDDDYGYSPY